jgi:hypothetical protein
LADAVGSVLTFFIERPPGSPVASLRSPLPSALGTEGRELPGQCPQGRSPEQLTPWSRPRLRAPDDDSDCARRRSPPYGVLQTRLVATRHCVVLVGTVPLSVRTEPVASSGAVRRKLCDHEPVAGAAHEVPLKELGTQCPLSSEVETVAQGGSSRQPDPSATAPRLDHSAACARRHAVAKAVSSCPFAGVGLERPLHLSLVSSFRCRASSGLSRRGGGPVRQVRSTRRYEHCNWRAKAQVHQTAGTGLGNLAHDPPGAKRTPRGRPITGVVRFRYTLRARPAVHTCGCWCGELLDRRASSW